VLVLATLGASERRRRPSQRKRRPAAPEPDPTLVATGRATIIDVGAPFVEEHQARAWLARAGEDDLDAGIEVLNRALHAFRVVTANAYLNAVSREQALVARIGFGVGEQVADGQWSDASELVATTARQRRIRALQPQARLAAVLGGRERALACQELALRARLDLDQGRAREAALQLLVALDAALAELATDPTADVLAERIAELRGHREGVIRVAQAALAGQLDGASRELVESSLGRIEAALRARAVALE
jgi:hypothetical protein